MIIFSFQRTHWGTIQRMSKRGKTRGGRVVTSQSRSLKKKKMVKINSKLTGMVDMGR